MKKETVYVKIDSRNRISIHEKWLFDPKNKAIVDELKKALKQKAHKND